jgi:hypothetical protein
VKRTSFFGKALIAARSYKAGFATCPAISSFHFAASTSGTP